MPQPTMRDIHVDVPLTNISIAYTAELTDFIAPKVAPIIPVNFQSNKYYIYDKAYWKTSQAKKRAPGAQSAGSGWSNSTANYTCDEYGVHKDIPDQVRANADPGIDLERDAARWVTEQMYTIREEQWASSIFAASTWTGSSTGADITVGTTWDDDASTPIEDVETQRAAIKEKTGFFPNTMVVGYEVWSQLKNHPDLIDRIKHTQRGVLTEELVAQLLGVERFFVASATRNTAAEAATATMDFVFGKNALLMHVARSPALLTPSACYTFAWTGYTGASREGFSIDQWYMREIKSQRVEGTITFDMKVVAADLGAYFASVVA